VTGGISVLTTDGDAALAAVSPEAKTSTDVRTGYVADHPAGDETHWSAYECARSCSKRHIIDTLSSANRRRDQHRGANNHYHNESFHDADPHSAGGRTPKSSPPLTPRPTSRRQGCQKVPVVPLSVAVPARFQQIGVPRKSLTAAGIAGIVQVWPDANPIESGHLIRTKAATATDEAHYRLAQSPCCGSSPAPVRCQASINLCSDFRICFAKSTAARR
jgi:hypothetical protein